MSEKYLVFFAEKYFYDYFTITNFCCFIEYDKLRNFCRDGRRVAMKSRQADKRLEMQMKRRGINA